MLVGGASAATSRRGNRLAEADEASFREAVFDTESQSRVLSRDLTRRYYVDMDKETILATLKAAELLLKEQGVAHAALFGSVARGEQHADSDIDIMVEIDPAVRIGVYGYVTIMNHIKDMFPIPVDVSNRASLKDHVRPSAERDAIFAF